MTMRRYRDWLPFCTQQLRLRNLTRIEGYSIYCETNNLQLDLNGERSETFIYYTLHTTKDAEAFYTSELLPQRQIQLKWAEIIRPEMLKSNANCVCVKVWSRIIRSKKVHGNSSVLLRSVSETMSAPSSRLSNTCLTTKHMTRPPDDKLIFAWGVYFSGLVLLNPQADTNFEKNSLIFQINGQYFTAPAYLSIKNEQPKNEQYPQRQCASLPKISHIAEVDHELCTDAVLRLQSPRSSQIKMQFSRSSSPANLVQKSEIADKSDNANLLKKRFALLNCLSNDVRNSYDLKKLLQIQELQRLRLLKRRDINDFTKDIQRRSICCITNEQLAEKALSSVGSLSHHYHQQYHSMGRTLSLLLAEQQQKQYDPQIMLRTQELQRQVESFRCKQSLLRSERETYAKRLSQLRQRLFEAKETRHERESWLKEHNDKLENERLELAFCKQEQVEQARKKRHSVHQVKRRMASLCIELSEIYPIGRNNQGFYTICSIPLPHIDAYVNDPKYVHSIGFVENLTPTALSSSLGYVAHLVQMISVVINRPLRNPIVHEGSRSRIMDVVKNIPFGSREFPLYTRSNMPSKPVKYAILLLNQNIAQLCYDLTGIRCDLIATIENLRHIFARLAEIEQTQYDDLLENNDASNYLQHTNNHFALHHPHHPQIQRYQHQNDKNSNINNSSNGEHYCSSNGCGDCLSNSQTSVDMNHIAVPVVLTVPTKSANTASNANGRHTMLPSSQPLPIADCLSPQSRTSEQRVSRSVGSYSDCEDDFKEINQHHCFSNSDSTMYKLTK